MEDSSSDVDESLELVEPVGPDVALVSLLGAVVGDVVGATEPVIPVEVDDVAPVVVVPADEVVAVDPVELDVGMAVVGDTTEVVDVGWPVVSPPGGDGSSAEQAHPKKPAAASQTGLK